jgi:hypothetical protein
MELPGNGGWEAGGESGDDYGSQIDIVNGIKMMEQR